MKIEEFLEKSLTSFHAVQNCEKILLESNFKRLYLGDKWNLKKGGKYYLIKNDNSIIAFVIGDVKECFFNIAVTHTDSPALLVKGKDFVYSDIGYKINVEAYGSMNYYTLLDTPLKLAGRIVVKDGKKLKSKIVQSNCSVIIPSLAIHQKRDINDGLKLSVQNDLLPLAGDVKDVYSFLQEKNIVDHELFLVSDIKPFRAGINKEYLCSPRIDDLISVWAAIKAISSCDAKGISIACCFDNEEIQSLTKQGANSSLLPTVLNLIKESLSMPLEKYVGACEKGLMLSIDNSHSIHPAHPETSDIINQIHFDGGVVIKHNTTYCTDAYSSAQIKVLLQKNKIKYQDFYYNSDIECATTLGPYSSSLLHMNACDIGVAQLSMHSTVETIGYSDLECLQKCCKVFFEAKFNCEN